MCRMWQFWIDRGGTFTDIVARRPDGSLVTHKLLSENPEQYKDAAVQGVRELIGVPDGSTLPPSTIAAVKMGTTVATNALLERKGDPTLLLITEGLGDLLRIGYQNRPRLFDLKIELPALLYCDVGQVRERLDAEGKVVTPLDLESARIALQRAFDNGVRGVAIAFMHAYLNPQHELAVAGLAREMGFTQVSTSHETSKLIKLVSRGDTTVVDAYLTPILRRYVDQVAEALDVEGGACERLMFMQSSGGLTDARLFQGKDAILSGPAGGVVGMVKTAGLAGFDKLIGFDMGGTSTDVCHYAGEYERSFETEVAGVRMRAPMMNIHTVAAGGGSILSFRDGRYQVGPESAGANPGPACYRRGGPLTVTDCNVMLGKLNPEHFPNVFGPHADQPLDAEIVRLKFAEMAQEIANRTGSPPLTAEETAEGFLRVAVENMANAIKKISVQRGYNVTAYTLNCFGGAGGQHACLVADALGMTSVFIHPFAGVLSAYGMGLAEIRAMREEQFDGGVDDSARAREVLDRIEAEVHSEVAQQGVEAERIRTELRAHLRYAGSHQTLEVAFGTAEEMQRRFDAAHEARYGFASPSRELIIDMLAAEAIGLAEAASETLATGRLEDAMPRAAVRMLSDGSWTDAPLYERDELAVGQIVAGPAIITERTGTNVVEDGWQARIDNYGNLVLTRIVEKARRAALGTEADPIMLEVFNNLFMSIAEQMGATLANTAYSVNIKERLDFSCALFDASGGLVANAPHVPVHLGSMSQSVRTVLEMNRGKIRPGDSYMLNNPFEGGTHLPDVTVITPVFDEAGEEILFFVGSRGHHADIGGRTPGSAPPDSRHIDEEGVLISNFKLVEDGRLLGDETRALLGSGRYPCRNIDQNMADLEAQIAANETGVREVRRMIATYGQEAVIAYMGHVQDNAEESVRRVITRLENGHFTYPLDSGAQISVTITVDPDAREAAIDFTGTSGQDEGNYNAPSSISTAVVLYVFRTLVGADIPMNEGCLKPLRIIAPAGTMINPQYPAAVIAGNTEVSQSIADCLYGALGVIAGSQGTMNNFVWGNDRLQNYETICGGTGAGPDFSGASAVHSHMTNTRMTDPEVLEKRFPVRVEEFAIRRGSGGSGAHSGGDGIVRKMRFLEAMTVTTLTSHRKTRPFGVRGGEDGACGENSVLRSDGQERMLEGNDHAEVAPDDVFCMKTPGGGGWGVG
ncbi:hydantoinase B/oxoprolinase family protein [Hoeflea sp. E7-10]|uniref:Hydantoinase B/oxoprolinase family protein n=2 Tax=Hoeflea poritis TaxID=2993659 RepID=A0ABT4VPS9_9HYPH|nr:hydantoinase B/oxoprolinase family protein [Hoeflea poritis]MDA4846718.1 hydantoinase B/oxoprolinase family protein [Hoeflea poritis]